MNKAIQQKIQELKQEVSELVVKAHAMRRLLNDLMPMLKELEALDAGTASPIGDIVVADYAINLSMVETAQRHALFHKVAYDYINGRGDTVYVAKLKQDLAETLDLLGERQVQLKAYQS